MHRQIRSVLRVDKGILFTIQRVDKAPDCPVGFHRQLQRVLHDICWPLIVQCRQLVVEIDGF